MPPDLPPEPAPPPADRPFADGPADLTFPAERPAVPAPPPAGPPGPGLPESIAWCVGWFVTVQLFLMIPVAFAVQALGWALLGRAPTLGETSIAALPIVQIAGGLLTLAAFRWRIGPLRKLGLGLPSGPATLVACLSLPAVMFASTQWAAVAGALWAAACEAAPALEAMDGVSSLTAVNELLRSVPLPALILAAAVCPALAEELFCRGLIGRGLVARWGVWRGVALTSILFCLLHLHPAHAGALLPIAIFLHVAYLSSRSLWLPVGLHFANNAAGLMLGKALLARDALPDPHAAPPPNLALFLVATGLAGLACWAVWSVRLRTVDRRGGEIAPRWPTVEGPPASAPLWSVVRWEAAPLALWGLFVPGFGAVMGLSLLALLMGWVEM
ncbi:CPBP family intramembrane glutamic endopeptidase [Alienimonas californiensis]|uniref:CAAX amino terminal protease self-immunity n=1 Tax=Alienimonas californiensis TaxID=2527989 RepID=A0A517P8D6_9PLAN|nr:CPBP family intramembrane glutamic endopeptidase [Alienimonas californiensis]QDT15639.1 CAAX amino terminal protease self- immunity [Alienimonas californiensis]